ncbi:hypothetical protein HDV02_003829 [Globomyces sp. JEL0801]|nr:hypothetical protein HDV02_003829 [Globomyces sp. JEL0801]
MKIENIKPETTGHHTLGRAMYMIPQEPTLFEGNIRTNIDWKGIYGYGQRWNALDICGMKPDYQMDWIIKFLVKVVGQKQLLCTVGAVIENPKVKVFDESTSDLDGEADNNSTVIKIAHRLNTIASYDRVLVLDQGRMVEYTSPKDLVLDKYSLFNELGEATLLLPLYLSI